MTCNLKTTSSTRSLKKTGMELKKVEALTEINFKKKEQVEMKTSAPEKHCFESKETHKVTREIRKPRWLLLIFKKR